MSDPRASIAFDGQFHEELTFQIDASTITYLETADNGSASVGLGVTSTSAGDGTVKLLEDGEGVLGKLLKVSSDGYCTVQVGGVMRLPQGNGASITEMKRIVGALGAASAKGYIREVNTAVAAELGVARGLLLEDAADSAGLVGVLL